MESQKLKELLKNLMNSLTDEQKDIATRTWR